MPVPTTDKTNDDKFSSIDVDKEESCFADISQETDHISLSFESGHMMAYKGLSAM